MLGTSVRQGVFPDIAACSDAWVTPLLQPPEAPDPALTPIYDALFDGYLATRKAMAPVWAAQARMREKLRCQ